MSTIITGNGITTNQIDSTVINQNGVNVADDNELANVNTVAISKATLVEAQAYDLGVGQTWQDVTASRSAGVTYTNTTGKPIELQIRNSGASAANTATYISINGLPNVLLNGGWGSTHASSIIIPHSSTYNVTTVGGTISQWFELR